MMYNKVYLSYHEAQNISKIIEDFFESKEGRKIKRRIEEWSKSIKK